MSAIELQQLQLINFRNYRQLIWKCRPGLNIIQGSNAIGKTNLLESIGYLAFARSFRQQQDQRVAFWGTSYFKIKGICTKNKNPLELAVAYQNNSKTVTINNNRSRLIELLGIFPVIFFAPDDLYLVKGSPVYRRQYLDREISILDRTYCQNLQTYRRILLQRNRLLKNIKIGQSKRHEIKVWDEQLLNFGIAIIQKRAKFLKSLASLTETIYYDIGGQKKLLLYYQPSIQNAEEWKAKINERQRQEIEAGMSLWGPHRDDFNFFIDNRAARFFASQGQQRLSVLALKIAEAKYFQQVLSVMPVMLLDDVFSELDGYRQRALLDLLNDIDQAFLTTTEVSKIPLNLLADAAIWQLNGDNSIRLINT